MGGLVLLALTLLAATTGVLTGGLLGSATARAADGIHELFGSLLQLMVFLHIAGVIVDWVLTRDNIVVAMWHGRKRVEEVSADVGAAPDAPRDARGGSVLLAAVIAVPLIAFGGYVMTPIDLTAAPGRSSSDSETD